MIIENFRISTSLGHVNGKTLDFLSEEELNEFNRIGHSGKNSQGVKMGRVEYLNSLRPKEEQFQLTKIKWDNGDFQEEFILTRVTIPQK